MIRNVNLPSLAVIQRRLSTGSLGSAGSVVLALAGLLVLKWTAGLVVPLLCAFLLFMLLSPAAEAMQKRGVPGVAAAASLVFVPAVVLAALGVWLAPSAWAWARQVTALVTHIAAPYAARNDMAGVLARKALGELSLDGAAASGWLAAGGTAALACATVLMLVFFLLMGQRSLLAAVLAAMPERRARVRTLATLRDARTGIATCLSTMAIVNLGVAASTALVAHALDVPAAGVWLVVVYVLLFIPYLGPLLVMLLLAAAGSGTTVLTLPAAFLAIHAVEAHFISPWWMGRRLAMARPALLVGVIAGAWAWGVAGGLLAVPVLIVAQAVLRHTRGFALGRAALAGESAASPSLEATAEKFLQRGVAPPPSSGSSRVRQMPASPEDASSCTSPTSPKPIRPKSTAWR